MNHNTPFFAVFLSDADGGGGPGPFFFAPLESAPGGGGGAASFVQYVSGILRKLRECQDDYNILFFGPPAPGGGGGELFFVGLTAPGGGGGATSTTAHLRSLHISHGKQLALRSL